MSKQMHLASGMRDLFGDALLEKRAMMDRIRSVFLQASFSEIATPAIEYFDVFGQQIGTTPSRELFKFFDHDGETLVLRPDFTPSIARAVTTYFMDAPRPLRLWYEGSTYINRRDFQGTLKEFTQMGIECIGEGGVEQDAWVIQILIQALLSAGLDTFQISIGEVNFFKGLVRLADLNDEEAEKIRDLILKKNYFGMSEVLHGMDLVPQVKDAFAALPTLFGDSTILKKALSYAANDELASSIQYLQSIDEILHKEGLSDYISYDLGLLSKYRYYTGIVFSAFSYGSSDPIAKGGRYDDLLQEFGAAEAAVGAAMTVENVMMACRVTNDRRMSHE